MKGLNFKCEGNAITIKIYGEIGVKDFWESLFTPEEEDKDSTIVQSLDELNKLLKENQNAATIDIFINSTGGSIFDGVAMYNVLKRHKAYKKVFIDGFACSVASVIAMCGNQIIMPKSSMMMIHNAWTVAMGNANELRKQADDLDKINETVKNAYRSKMKIEDSKLTELMDNETYLSADECLEYGLCTKVADDEDGNIKASVDKGLEHMKNLYQNKLDSLNAIKNCIKDIEQDVEPTKTGEEGAGEPNGIEPEQPKQEEPKKDEPEKVEPEQAEGKPTIEQEKEGIENTVQNQVKNIKENALMRFFNSKEDKTNE